MKVIEYHEVYFDATEEGNQLCKHYEQQGYRIHNTGSRFVCMKHLIRNVSEEGEINEEQSY